MPVLFGFCKKKLRSLERNIWMLTGCVLRILQKTCVSSGLSTVAGGWDVVNGVSVLSVSSHQLTHGWKTPRSSMSFRLPTSSSDATCVQSPGELHDRLSGVDDSMLLDGVTLCYIPKFTGNHHPTGNPQDQTASANTPHSLGRRSWSCTLQQRCRLAVRFREFWDGFWQSEIPKQLFRSTEFWSIFGGFLKWG